MPEPKTVPYVVNNVKGLRKIPEEVKEAVVSEVKEGMVSKVKYERHMSYDGGTYWAAEDVNIPESAKIYKDVIIGPNCEIGEEVVISEGVELSAGTEIGILSTIDWDSKIGPGTVIGERVNIGKNCEIDEKVVIGDGVQIDDNVTIKKGSIDDENGPRIGDRAHIFEYTIVEGDVEEGGRVGPEEYYRKTDPEREEEKHLKKEFKEDSIMMPVKRK